MNSFHPGVRRISFVLALVVLHLSLSAATQPERFVHGAVVTQDKIASDVGVSILKQGGNAVDAAVATAFALAVTHPAAGNIGGGGFLLLRLQSGNAHAYDFRETAPAGSQPSMFLTEGRYDAAKHHDSHLSVGVPGTVAGLHLAWKQHGSLPWRSLVTPAVELARRGFPVSTWLADSLRQILPSMTNHPASIAQFSKRGVPYSAGDILIQRDLAETLERIATKGPAGFYEGKTADLVVREMQRHGGILTLDDLKNYKAVRREPIQGSYRGHDILSMPPPSSGGISILEMLNILEGYDLKSLGRGSAASVHLIVEAMRRAFADRARFLGDPDFNPDLPVQRLVSREHAAQVRATISTNRASVSTTNRFEWAREGSETTHLSVVDANRNAVALTYTLEYSYGSRIVVPGAGFILNNEMGDFNPVSGMTTETGLIGTSPNLVAPGKRMLSSMSPTIVTRDGKLLLVTGSPGGRTIISTVLMTILNCIDFGLNAQAAVDAPRLHHQWLPDKIFVEKDGFSPDSLSLLRQLGHRIDEIGSQGAAQVIRVDASGRLEAAADRRAPDSSGSGY